MANWHIDEALYPGPPEQPEQIFVAKSLHLTDEYGNIIASIPFSSAPMQSGDTLTFSSVEVKIGDV